MICICMPTFASTSVRWAISFSSSSRSASSLPLSSPVRARRRISMMAEAWMSDNSKRSIIVCLAASGVCDERMMCTISSMLSCAISRPCTICRRSSAFFRSKRARRTTTSWRCSMKYLIRSRIGSICGRPLTSAMLFTANDVCSGVFLNSVFSTTLATASCFRIMMIRRPLRSDSSLM